MTGIEQLTDGLALYEVLLFVLGSLLFLVLLFLIVLFAVRKRPLKPLLLFFTVPIVMLGWPSIAKIQVSNEGITLVNNLRELEKRPADTLLQNKVEQSIQVLEEKQVNAPDLLANIARAKYILGQDKDALETISRIPEEKKMELGVATLQKTIIKTQDFERKLEKAKVSPTPESLEILKITKSQIEADDKLNDNRRLQRYVRLSDSLIQETH